MTGQVVRIDVYRKRATIDLVSAGDEQVVTCVPIVYLEASVDGDMNGHTFEWVQMTGIPTVTLMPGGNPLQAYYVVENLGSDKIFRFYIDRNTQIQQYADVIVRTTPSSVIGNIESGYVNGDIPALPFTLINPFELVGDFMFNIVPFTGAIKLLDANDTFASWKLPQIFYQAPDPSTDTYRNGFLGTVLQEFTGSSWVDVAFFQPVDARLYSVNTPKRLRVGSLFNIPNKGATVIYNQWENVTAEGGALIQGKDVIAQIEHGYVVNNVVSAKVIYRLDLQTYSENVYQTEHGAVVNNIVANKIVYILDIQTHTSNASQTEHGVISSNITFTRVFGSVIGGS